MKKYEILEHKADLKIKVFGETKEELFKNAVFGMQECMKPETKKLKAGKRIIKVSSPDLLALLVDFLSEVLYLIQVNKEIYDSVKFERFSDTEIEAELSCKKAERFSLDVKAVTHHKLDIRRRKGAFEATIIFDI